MKIKAFALTALLACGALSLPTESAEAHGRRGAAVAAGVLGGLALGFGAYAYGPPVGCFRNGYCGGVPAYYYPPYGYYGPGYYDRHEFREDRRRWRRHHHN